MSKKVQLAAAYDKQTNLLVYSIAYDEANDNPILSLINSMYWNSKPRKLESGTEIVKSYSFKLFSVNL